MLTIIDKVQFEYQKAKREKYAEIFVNSILIGNQINFDEKRMFIQLFSELSEADIQLLGKFNRKSHFRIDLEHFRKREVAPGLFGLEEVVPLVNRLEARGLISEMPNAKEVIHWDGIRKILVLYGETKYMALLHLESVLVYYYRRMNKSAKD